MSKISLQMYTLRNYTTNMEDLDRTLSKLKEIGFEMLQYSIPGHFDPKEVTHRCPYPVVWTHRHFGSRASGNHRKAGSLDSPLQTIGKWNRFSES